MALPSMWSQFLAAIRAQESGNYSQDTAGCLGAYCWSSQATWDGMAKTAGETKYIGVNPSQVPAAVQDKVASTNLYRIYQQSGGGAGGLRAAAMWWNGGTTQSENNPGLPSQPWAKQCGGGSSAAYACQVIARMSLGGHYLSGAGSGAGGVVTLAAGKQADCAITLPIPGLSFNFNPFGGSFGPNVTTSGQCILSKSEARAILAVLYMSAGASVILVGLALSVVIAGPGRRILQLVMPVAGKAGVPTAGASSRVTHESGYGTIPASDAARAARTPPAGASTRATHESGYGTIPASEAARSARADAKRQAASKPAPAAAA